MKVGEYTEYTPYYLYGHYYMGITDHIIQNAIYNATLSSNPGTLLNSNYYYFFAEAEEKHSFISHSALDTFLSRMLGCHQ